MRRLQGGGYGRKPYELDPRPLRSGSGAGSRSFSALLVVADREERRELRRKFRGAANGRAAQPRGAAAESRRVAGGRGESASAGAVDLQRTLRTFRS